MPRQTRDLFSRDPHSVGLADLTVILEDVEAEPTGAEARCGSGSVDSGSFESGSGSTDSDSGLVDSDFDSGRGVASDAR